MFMLTIQKANLKKIGALALCGAVIAAAAMAGKVVEKNTETAAVSASIESTQDIQSYFLGFGLEVDPTDITADKVKVPKKWNDSFSAFNNIVAQSGSDLSECKGKTVEKWLAAIPSLGTGEQSMYGVLLLRDQKVVGAYILEKPSGNVKGLTDIVQAKAAEEEKAKESAAAAPEEEEVPVSLDVDVAVGADGYPVE